MVKKSWRVKRKKKRFTKTELGFSTIRYQRYFIGKHIYGLLHDPQNEHPIPDFKFVELYINDIYEGIYLETQHIDEIFFARTT